MNRSIHYAIILSQLIFFLCLPFFWQLFSYLHPVVLITVWMYVTAFVCFSFFLIRKQSIDISRAVLGLLLLIYSLGLFILLFFRPGAQTYDTWNLVPFSTIGFYLAGNTGFLVAFYNLAANIGLFIPFGIALMLAVKSRVLRFLIPLFSISAIELTQFITQRGSLDIDDLILNLVGVYIGCWITPVFLRVVKIKKS